MNVIFCVQHNWVYRNRKAT